MSGRIIAVDVGGTFIDLVAVDTDSGAISIEKQPATPERLTEEVLAGLSRLPGAPADARRLVHGSTVAINALLQRRGARVGLITTRGFRDVLELGRGNRPDIYDWLYVPPDPLVERGLRREVAGRIGPDGAEIEPLDLAAVQAEAVRLSSEGVEAIAISFLHAYANPGHERAAAAAIRERFPEMPIALSSDVATEWHEYERTSTAVIDASLQPVAGGYLRRLRERLTEEGFVAPLEVMRSNGGIVHAEGAAALPSRTLASGPAGGVIGVRSLSELLSHPNAICADVGGTTFDVSILEEGRVLERTETQIEGLPVLAPTIDIVSIGAGGGSIARLDETGALRVGPDSAGARPGPACFGLGGTEPTVTDAHVIIGWLDPETFLGSRMHLDAGAAARAIDDRIGGPLHLPTHLAADGIVRIAEFAMANAISSVTVERGADPRDFALYAFGGGGGLFAASVADELEIPIVVIPREPASFSAWGMLGADVRSDATATIVARLDADAIERAVKEVDALRDRLLTEFEGRGTPRNEVRIGSFAELRFEGQEHTVGVPFDPEGGTEFVEPLKARFVERHRRLYGHGDPDAAIEIVAVRGRATVPTVPPRWPAWTDSGDGDPEVRRPVYFRAAGGWLDTAVYARDHLAAGRVVDGPAIVREWSSTTILPPGWTARTDDLGNLLLERS